MQGYVNGVHMMTKRKTAFIVVLFFCPVAVYAQYIPTFQPAMDIGVAGSLYLGDEGTVSDLIREPRSSSRNNFERVAPSFSSAYIPQKNRTQANLQNFIEKIRPADPSGAQQLEQLFASTDIIGAIGSIMQGVGLDKNNAADAFAVYWVSAWQASSGELQTASGATYRAVAAQSARLLSVTSVFADANDAQKQEMAEALMVQAAVIDSHKDAVGGDSAKMKALSKAVIEGASASGLELDKMTLTEEGFVPRKGRKGADASDLVRGDRALASAESDNTLTYGIMGVVGLGAAFMIGKGMRKA
jgi:hypothetical protein